MAFTGFPEKRPLSQIGSESESHFLPKHPKRVIIKRLGLEELPTDIIFNILLRLPVKSLLQCRRVCKTLRNLVDSPRFASLHLTSPLVASAQEPHQLMVLYYHHENYETNKTLRLLLLKDDNTNTLSRSPFPIAEIANAKRYCVDSFAFGLFCFKDFHFGGKVFLFNPLKGEILMLPPPILGPSPLDTGDFMKDFYGLWFDSTEETYKLVRVFYHDTYYTYDTISKGAEVYTFTTSSWRAISAVLPHRLAESRSVSAYGDVHWKVQSYPPNGSLESMIITFDTRKEEFKYTSHPDFPSKNTHFFHLLDWKGSLAMVDMSSTTHMDIWLLKDYCKKEWAREYRISIEMWLTEEEAKFGSRFWARKCVKVVGVWEDDLIFETGGQLFYYNTKTDCVRIMRVSHGGAPFCADIFSYSGSLVSLQNYGKLIRRQAGHGNYFDLDTASMVSTFKSVKI